MNENPAQSGTSFSGNRLTRQELVSAVMIIRSLSDAPLALKHLCA